MTLDGIEIQVIPRGQSGFDPQQTIQARKAWSARKEVDYGGTVYRSQKHWGKAMGFTGNTSAICAKYLLKGEYKGIELKRVKCYQEIK